MRLASRVASTAAKFLGSCGTLTVDAERLHLISALGLDIVTAALGDERAIDSARAQVSGESERTRAELVHAATHAIASTLSRRLDYPQLRALIGRLSVVERYIVDDEASIPAAAFAAQAVDPGLFAAVA